MSGIVTTDGRAVRSRGQRTRARLMDAAAGEFARRGFHATRVDDIVAAADASHGTFYVYFASKDALFDELVAQAGAEMVELVDDLPALNGTDQDRAALRTWLERFADFYERSGTVLQAWTEVESATEPAGVAGSDLLAHMALAVGARLALPDTSSRPDRVDPAIAALALMAMIERFHDYAATTRLRATPEEVVETLVDVLFAAAAPVRAAR